MAKNVEVADEPDENVDMINLDCYNELYPSDSNCDGAWLYLYDEKGWSEWRKDESLSLYCKGSLKLFNPK